MADILLDIPTVEYPTYAAMQAARASAPWFKKRYVFIKNNETLGGGWSFHLYTNITDPQTGEQTDTLLQIAAQAGSMQPIGIPPGGLKDQVLVKASDADYDTTWKTVTLDAGESSGLLLAPGTRLKLGTGKLLKL